LAALFPKFTEGLLFSGIFIHQVFAFIFNHEIPSIFQFANEIRVKFVCGGLQPEGVTLTPGQIPYPEIHSFQGVNILGALEFLSLVF
jgi:hypothetical protein